MKNIIAITIPIMNREIIAISINNNSEPFIAITNNNNCKILAIIHPIILTSIQMNFAYLFQNKGKFNIAIHKSIWSFSKVFTFSHVFFCRNIGSAIPINFQ